MLRKKVGELLRSRQTIQHRAAQQLEARARLEKMNLSGWFQGSAWPWGKALLPLPGCWDHPAIRLGFGNGGLGGWG